MKPGFLNCSQRRASGHGGTSCLADSQSAQTIFPEAWPQARWHKTSLALTFFGHVAFSDRGPSRLSLMAFEKLAL
jgi:hypothetical protein